MTRSGALTTQGTENAPFRAPFRKDDKALQELTKDLVPAAGIVVYHKTRDVARDSRTLAWRANKYLRC